ncbi:23S rRNA (guanosine(2251)-2'-O)-methyltransferase [Flavobacteriaceae bacterium UJ101]|nr:23S rRNA (guanosine(2251)-2'-O)-methyltransferase [Flavobacteriaceae bacterium UJ101]
MQQDNMVFGLRPVIEAINSGKTLDSLFIQTGLKGEIYAELKGLIKKYNISSKQVPAERLNRFTRKNHQGIVAFISPIDFHRIEDLLPKLYEEGKTPLLLILDRVTDARNFGAIVRTAECTGVDAIIIPKKNAAPINADAIKTSTGAIYNIPICKESDLKAVIEYIQDYGLQAVAASEKTNDTLYDLDMKVPTAIIMGSEENGVSLSYIKAAQKVAKLPMYGKIGSLNVSVACGAFLYECVRQRME